ncbi:hypothetical protein P9314_26385 [Paenibacillus validus]|uniref:hypothetical protein n=1 Tax=Paenibacillus TaxID=44249 RepID=UPI000AD7CE1F|nr:MULTISPECIES: hypothetical protein [Paenibacillus]MED4604160.1 hypothetical protein [Paenibacillus validus]MED4609602.1 hypothetical protein [Paenibacillus validus]
MSKIVILCLMVVFIFGICTYVFRPGAGGLQDEVRNGHDTMTMKIRSFDYVTN